jgi:AbrB family looped-hinge helix DNA binding protein
MNPQLDKHIYSFDKKNRLVLPKHIRDVLNINKGDQLHLTPFPGDFPHLEIRTAKAWEKYIERIKNDVDVEAAREALQVLTYSTELTSMDGQGRIMIPVDEIRQPCKLDDLVTVLNLYDYIEVWNPEIIKLHHSTRVQSYLEVRKRIF